MTGREATLYAMGFSKPYREVGHLVSHSRLDGITFIVEGDSKATVWASDRLVVVLDGWTHPHPTWQDLELELRDYIRTNRPKVLAAYGGKRITHREKVWR